MRAAAACLGMSVALIRGNGSHLMAGRLVSVELLLLWFVAARSLDMINRFRVITNAFLDRF